MVPTMKNCILWSALSLLLSVAVWPADAAAADGLLLHSRSRVESRLERGQFDILSKPVSWDAKKTAVIICDMWDWHYCKSATARTVEMAPRMNAFVTEARKRGALIVHAPSGCMATYAQHPARRRAQEAPNAKLPEFLKTGCLKIDAEKDAPWPLDQSDGGCDCTPKCPLPKEPYLHQNATLKIADEDAISDSGVEIGNLFAQRGIDNVILLGVHTNMCVVGRPFGLRNMVRLGKNVVLVRDLTDTMYNHRMAPQVSHIRGTELMIEYIEKYICPTITSTDLLGGAAFRFRADRRPHVVLLSYEDEYHSWETLPVFAQQLCDRFGCYCSVLLGEKDSGVLGLEELATADVLVLYMRRHALPKEQMAMIHAYLARKKPLVGLRTACHAFDIKAAAPPGMETWPAFDHDVLGGNYHGHTHPDRRTEVTVAKGAAGHPILAGIAPGQWMSTGTLYNVSPVDPSVHVLLLGRYKKEIEPVAWTRDYHGSRVFFSSLGHVDDFQTPRFCTLLVNAIFWAMDKPVPPVKKKFPLPPGEGKG
jgi:type 1 glutamine amidotransferase/nicotinamidase-related amidase